jgi:hypothetical protein
MSFSLTQFFTCASFACLIGCSSVLSTPDVSSAQRKPVPAVMNHGTAVGRKAAELSAQFQQVMENQRSHDSDFQKVQNKISQDSAAYYETMRFMQARLQKGTTRSNPILLEKWNEATKQLEIVAADVSGLSQVAGGISGNLDTLKYLQSAIKSAYLEPGAVDEDHDRLRLLEDQVGRLSVQLDILFTQVSESIPPQEAYLSQQRKLLTVFAQAIHKGHLDEGQSKAFDSITSSSLPKTAVSQQAVMQNKAQSSEKSNLLPTQKPLIVISFEKGKPDYEKTLSSLLQEVLARKPDASFEILTRTTGSGSPARMKKETAAVFKMFLSLGIPSGRVAMSSQTNPALLSDDIQIFIK